MCARRRTCSLDPVIDGPRGVRFGPQQGGTFRDGHRACVLRDGALGWKWKRTGFAREKDPKLVRRQYTIAARERCDVDYENEHGL